MFLPGFRTPIPENGNRIAPQLPTVFVFHGSTPSPSAGSLLSYLLKNNIDVDHYESFEAIYEDLRFKVPQDTKLLMRLACEFNRLVYAAGRIRDLHPLERALAERTKNKSQGYQTLTLIFCFDMECEPLHH